MKLRALLLKNKKLKEQLDLTNKENINYFEIKGIDIIKLLSYIFSYKVSIIKGIKLTI